MSGFFLFEDARVFFTPAPVKTIMRKDDVAMIMGTTEDLIIRKCQSAARKSMLIYLVFLCFQSLQAEKELDSYWSGLPFQVGMAVIRPFWTCCPIINFRYVQILRNLTSTKLLHIMRWPAS